MKIFILASFLLFQLILASGQSTVINPVPSRIILNLTENPSHSMGISWRTDQSYDGSSVQFAIATPWKTFLDSTISVPAAETMLQIERGAVVYHYAAVLNGLEPQTTYVYRVGHDSIWSEWNQFRTAAISNADFSFIWFGDPQNEIRDHCSRIFREAYKTDAEAAFWLFSGDLISEPEDWQYQELFYAADFIFRSTPSAMAPGNHDQGYLIENGQIARNEEGKKIRTKEVAPIWKASFTLPENGIPGFEEASYYFDYQNIRFIIINSNDRLSEQAVWMEKLLSSNPNRWTIVTMHHPFYSGGRDRDDDEVRDAFLPLMDKYHVDLVLTGHDHTYLRSFKLHDNSVVNWRRKGTVYVMSVSGPKQYPATTNYPHLMAKTGSNLQLFQVITCKENQLIYNCYTASGELFDSFTLKK